MNNGDINTVHSNYLNLFIPQLKTLFGYVLVFLCSAGLTWLIRMYTLRHAILDIPNERSSHSIPTPRGGGIAIVATFIIVTLVLGWAAFIENNLVKAIVVGGTIIAIIGYYDDVYTVSARIRIIVHLIAAMLALHWIGRLSYLDLGAWHFTLKSLGTLLTLLGITWCINFYNFMDGIDGLAGGEGIFLAVTSGLALAWFGAHNVAILMGLFSAAIAGFTVWNWPPAKIFLGDAGSGFLGYAFAVLGLYTVNKGFLPISFWLIILGVFLYDATFTLFYRVIQGKKWFSAHREHAYQHLIAFGISHKQVTISILLINVCILLPLACSVFFWQNQAFWLISASATSLWLVWFWINSKKII